MKLTLPALLLIIALAGCKKQPVQKVSPITTNQAASIVAGSLAVNAGGLLIIKNDVGSYAKSLVGAGKGCDVPDVFNLARQDNPSTNIEYNYAFGYSHTVNCNNNAAEKLVSNVTYDGSFDMPRVSAINSGSSSLTLVSLSGSAANYTISGTYLSSGTFTLNDGSAINGNNSVSITLKSLAVTKSSRAIVNGSADFVITGSTKKDTFSYQGSIVFKDATNAVITIEGNAYYLNTTTGEVTAQ